MTSSQEVPPALPDDVVAIFAGGGECGVELARLDWARSTVGHPSTWSPMLRTAVSIVLSSRYPLITWWGPDHVMLYNDALAPAFADNHPWALGRAGEQVLPEMWSVIGPMLDHVLTAGEATWRNDQPLPMKRRGFVEDTYWTYSYSPIRDETGTVAGVFTATSETTDRVLRERRLRVLNDIARALDRTRTLDEACTTAVEVVREGAPEDVPAAAVICATPNDRAFVGLPQAGMWRSQPSLRLMSRGRRLSRRCCPLHRRSRLIWSPTRTGPS